jgi:small ligand-binding sensory domain FIST
MTLPAASATTMRWASAHARGYDAPRAAAEVVAQLRPALGEGPVDLVLAFFTAPLVPGAEELREALARLLAPGCLAGVSGGGVISAHEEIEQEPALSVVAARLPDVVISCFLLAAGSWSEVAQDGAEFARHAPGAAGAELALLFGDPFSLDVASVLEGFARHAPGVRVVGGMASAAQQPGHNAIFLNDWLAADGGAVIAFHGALRADVVVSQGCRPIGPTVQVTRAERNVIYELDGVPAAERVQQIVTSLPDDEQRLLRQGLLLGKPVRSGAAGRGDYVIRNLIGHDPESGALALGDAVAAREQLRLHARDAETAREDLELLLSPQAFDTPAAAALLFSCNGRGRNLYPEPHGDITPLQEALGGAVPAGGFFCGGEIGPVGERNFVHGHTASIAIIRPKQVLTTP